MAAYPAKANIVRDATLDLPKGITTIADAAELGAFIDAMAPHSWDTIEVKVTRMIGGTLDKNRPDTVQNPEVTAIITMGTL